MRMLALVSMAVAGCSSSSGSGGASGGGDAAAAATCQAGMLVIDGTSAGSPHGAYALSNAQTAGTDFSATLPAGGSVALSWSGDATAGPVAVTGKLFIPADDEGPPATWCIYAPSTLRISGADGILDMNMLPAANDICEGAGSATAVTAAACFDSAP